MRIFTDEELYPVAQECEKTGKRTPQELVDSMSKGILLMRIGPGKHLHGVNIMDGAVKGEDFDYFHDLIITQKMVQANARVFQDGNKAGMTISLTAVLQFANNEAWKNKTAQEVFSGKKEVYLAITEAFAGSE